MGLLYPYSCHADDDGYVWTKRFVCNVSIFIEELKDCKCMCVNDGSVLIRPGLATNLILRIHPKHCQTALRMFLENSQSGFAQP